MVAFFESFGGLGLAFLGLSLTVALCCIGSAKGTGMWVKPLPACCAKLPSISPSA